MIGCAICGVAYALRVERFNARLELLSYTVHRTTVTTLSTTAETPILPLNLLQPCQAHQADQPCQHAAMQCNAVDCGPPTPKPKNPRNLAPPAPESRALSWQPPSFSLERLLFYSVTCSVRFSKHSLHVLSPSLSHCLPFSLIFSAIMSSGRLRCSLWLSTLLFLTSRWLPAGTKPCSQAASMAQP